MVRASGLFFAIIVSFSIYMLVDLGNAYGLKTGSYNFCQAHPLFPECVGWRTEAISDSYNRWFCTYVDIPKLCESKPDPEKKIELRGNEFCCKYIGANPIESKTHDLIIQEQLLGRDSPNISVEPLIIWTDRDHYNFKDKVTLYGKFDFTSYKIKKSVSEDEFDQTARKVNGTSIQTGRIVSETPTLDVDVKLNGKTILRNIPVHENGWFVAFFYLNNRYDFGNQNNLVEVEYILYDNVPLGGPKTHATYHFTSGDVAKENNDYNMWIDDTTLPNKIRYGVNLDNPERFLVLQRHDLVITRMITPEGYVIPIESQFSVKDLSAELSEFVKYGHGTYQIQVTYGNNVSNVVFEY